MVPQAGVAVALVVLLLVLATTSQGAFAISHWAPLGLFTTAVVIGALIARGGVVFRSRTVVVALVGIWGLVAWSLLSMTWAQSAGNAFRGSARDMFYAAIVTVPFVVPISRRSLAAVGWAITVGIGAIALYVLARLLSGNVSLFLAGRLNGPVNYRNATALLFVLPFWPLIVAAATGPYRRSVRALALSVASLGLALAFLTQSRGVLVGLVIGALVALLVGPDRVRRAWMAIVSVAIVAAASPLLLRAYHAYNGGHGIVTHHAIFVSAVGALLVTVAAFVIGLGLALLDNGLRSGSRQMQRAHRLARLALAGGALVAVIGGLAAIGNPVTYAQHKWDQFKNLNAATTTSTRYATVSGQRYDLWRVAIKEFDRAPIGGVGSDNYSFDYYRFRATNRNLDDPHSLLFALISENGIVGVLLFLTFLGGIGAVLVRRRPTMDDAARRDAVAPAAAGAVLLGQCMVDWIWLIPGLTAVGLLALSVAAAQAAAAGDPFEVGLARARPVARLVRPAWIALLAGCAACLVALFISDAYIQRARSAVSDPSAQLSAARTASTFNPWDVTPHYLEASAYESMGDRARAAAQLGDALSLEPQNFATLGVLGDFEARGHEFARARAFYRAALALDPLDSGLQQLARIGLTPSGR